MSKGLCNRLMRALALLDLAEGGDFSQEELVAQCIQLVESELNMCLVLIRGVPF